MTANAPYSFAQISGNNGLFNVSSDGVRQGTQYGDPSTRYRLRAGILSASETIPMWGGVGLYADVPGGSTPSAPLPSYSLGTVVGRATALTGSKKLVGFSVFDEAYGMVTTPTNPVPLAGSGGQVNWLPLGSLARIAVQCDPSLVSLRQATVLPQVSWDFTNQLLVPYLGSLTISSYTYNSTSGLVTLTMSAAVTFDAGDSITVASLNISGLNGTFTATEASGTTVEYTAPTGLSGSPSGGGTLTVGGSSDQALAVEVLDVMASNCEVVEWNGSLATWSYTGAAAIIALNPNG